MACWWEGMQSVVPTLSNDLYNCSTAALFVMGTDHALMSLCCSQSSRFERGKTLAKNTIHLQEIQVSVLVNVTDMSIRMG